MAPQISFLRYKCNLLVAAENPSTIEGDFASDIHLTSDCAEKGGLSYATCAYYCLYLAKGGRQADTSEQSFPTNRSRNVL